MFKLLHSSSITTNNMKIKNQNSDQKPNIDSQHYQHWIDSGISDAQIKVNLNSIASQKPTKRPEALERLYPTSETDIFYWSGGWVSGGFDLETKEYVENLVFRSNVTKQTLSPFSNGFNQTQETNYEYGYNCGCLAPAIPLELAEKHLNKYDGWESFRDNYQGDPLFCAWDFAINNPEKIPINVAEGILDTQFLINQNGLTIGLKDFRSWCTLASSGNKEKNLHPSLLPLLSNGRKINLWFNEPLARSKKGTIRTHTKEFGKKLFVGMLRKIIRS